MLLHVLLALAPIVQAPPSRALVFDAPAKHFTESLPIGNGRLGAMVFGGVERERIVLNESTMWSGSKQDADRKDAHEHLAAIREKLFAGDGRGAQELLQQHFTCAGPGSGYGNGKDVAFGCYQTLGELVLEFDAGEATDYRRTLDLGTAQAKVTYTQNGVRFEREALASGPDQVLAFRFTASKPGSISLRAKLARKESSMVALAGRDLVLAGELASGQKDVHGVQYAAGLRALNKGGARSYDGEFVSVRGADEVVLLVAARTSFVSGSDATRAVGDLDRAATKSWSELSERQATDHRAFFDRVALELPKGASADRTTPERLAALERGEEDPDLAGLLFDYGRYLLISSSRPNSPLPANLQGLWAEEYQTPWNGDFHININLQMNYWPAEVAALDDCTEPMLKLVEGLVAPGRKTAQNYYGARGWVAHVITNPWGFTSPGEGADWGSTCTGGAWMARHLWERWLYSRDPAVLERIYPTLRDAALFFDDMLVEEPTHHWLVTAPSNSPENAYLDAQGRAVNTCMGPTIDQQIVRELFGAVITASEALGADPELRAELAAKRARLAPHQIGKHGQVQEWLVDYDEAEPQHRHVSPLFGLYPSDQIDPRTTPELARAARVTLERRGDASTGWSLAWKIAFWARLGDGDRAWKLAKLLLKPSSASDPLRYHGGGTYPNLFCAHPPFQIDGNFGASAAVAEMLVQSHGAELAVLPALPKAWKDGRVRGLRARGNLGVDLAWKDGKLTELVLHSPTPRDVKVRVGDEVRVVQAK
ncbi:MAG: glycoside hydrolase N-terminal domain-containing protein [Planctomycetes bacterium]|nr:glycoside hydrolase N-terminal domain-containing protein [Planctomycetota bacterium]